MMFIRQKSLKHPHTVNFMDTVLFGVYKIYSFRFIEALDSNARKEPGNSTEPKFESHNL